MFAGNVPALVLPVSKGAWAVDSSLSVLDSLKPSRSYQLGCDPNEALPAMSHSRSFESIMVSTLSVLARGVAEAYRGDRGEVAL